MNQLPTEDVLFLEEKRILSIVEDLFSSLVLSDTKMPTKFLIDCLKPKSVVDKIVFDLTSMDFRSDAFLPRLRKAYECLLHSNWKPVNVSSGDFGTENGPFSPLKVIVRALLKIIMTTLIYKEVIAESSKLFTKVIKFSEKKILSLTNKRKFLIAVLAVFSDALSHTWQEQSDSVLPWHTGSDPHAGD
nr:unnamed protein product [Spirometra erinaceieuropaei]